jgi:hypothetical protein
VKEPRDCKILLEMNYCNILCLVLSASSEILPGKDMVRVENGR